MNLTSAVFGSSPGISIGAKVGLAALRALRTFLQGVAAAFAAGGPGSAILSTGYWETVGVAIIGAAITALVSFIQNLATFLPEDPTQRPRPQSDPAPTPPAA